MKLNSSIHVLISQFSIISMDNIKRSRKESDPKCLPINYKTLMEAGDNTNLTPICDTLEKTKTTFTYWNHVYNAIGNCPKPCTKYQYSGKLSTWIGYVPTPNIAILQYYFSTDELIKHEEYLLFDTMTIIGYVGGTLGLFIGFSFLDLVSRSIYFCFNVCKQRIRKRVTVTPELEPKTPNGELEETAKEESNVVELQNDDLWVFDQVHKINNSQKAIK